MRRRRRSPNIIKEKKLISIYTNFGGAKYAKANALFLEGGLKSQPTKICLFKPNSDFEVIFVVAMVSVVVVVITRGQHFLVTDNLNNQLKEE